jgi:hypothetical protein
MTATPSPINRRAARARSALKWALGITIALYLIPFGRLLLWPLTIFATFAHEMGHGLAGIAVGGRIEFLKLYANGSGLCRTTGWSGELSSAVVSAGGLLGPVLLGALLFFVARRATPSRVALYVGALACFAITALWVRTPFGVVYVLALGAALLWLARTSSPEGAQVGVVFAAMQLCLSVFSDIDYMFTRIAKVGGNEIPSDTAQIANALGGFFWMWGAAVAVTAFAVAGVGVWLFLRVATDE